MAEQLVTEPGADVRWLTVAQGARALGVTEHAVRRRIRRGTLDTKTERRGNRVRTLVAVPVAPAAEPDADSVEDVVATLRAQVADLQGERDKLLGLVDRLLEERRSLWAAVKAWIMRRLRS